MKRYIELSDELAKASELLNANKDFKPNTKIWDYEFIKWCKSLDQVKTLAVDNDLNPEQAIYHWSQYISNQIVLELFYDFGCKPVSDTKETRGMVEINGNLLIPTQVMLKNSQNPANLASRTGKNDYIRTSYLNGIEKGFKDAKNKLFIVYPSSSIEDYRTKRLDFETLANKVLAFVNYYKNNDVNKLEVNGNTIVSDIIVM